THRQEIKADNGFRAGRDGLAFERGDALFEKLAIKLEPDRRDVPALFWAKEVSRPADFEIAHGDSETAAQARVLFDGANAFARIDQQAGVPRKKEIGVGLVFVTSHAAAELVEVAQAETVGAVDDDGVGVGNIEAAFNDRGRQEDIKLAVDKCGHDFFELVA